MGKRLQISVDHNGFFPFIALIEEYLEIVSGKARCKMSGSPYEV
ncbi:hypothetical protein [Methanosarcina sp. DH2]|jgi:hypothetical protein|nr:hypothetical protein [Methanosarcina sp. DH2]